jgi:DNA-directed RNA polymerase subunit M/transcription elongation factor TFIIS
MNNDAQFIKVAQKVLSDRGDKIIDDIAVFNSLLADYTKGEYTRERRLLMRDLHAGRRNEVLSQIKNQNSGPPVKTQSPQSPANTTANAAAPVTRAAPPSLNLPANKQASSTAAGNARNIASEDEVSCIIRCPECGNVEEVTALIDINSRNIGHLCPACGNAWKIGFFGHCGPCGENVGFSNYSIGKWINVAATALFDVLSTKDNMLSNAIKMVKDFAWEITPTALSNGECPLCTQSHVECPKCGSAVPFPHRKRVDLDIVKCPACGQKMRHP